MPGVAGVPGRWRAVATLLLAGAAAAWVSSADAAEAAATASETATATRPPLDAKQPCRFELPQGPGGWATRPVRWDGACQGGLAQGRGVLRAAPPAGAPQEPVLLYFGTMERGKLALGAIDLPEGYVAGRFEGGKAVDDGERNTLIAAFREASAAAKAASERYRAAGNAASSKYYAQKAKQLAEQLD